MYSAHCVGLLPLWLPAIAYWSIGRLYVHRRNLHGWNSILRGTHRPIQKAWLGWGVESTGDGSGGLYCRKKMNFSLEVACFGEFWAVFVENTGTICTSILHSKLWGTRSPRPSWFIPVCGCIAHTFVTSITSRHNWLKNSRTLTRRSLTGSQSVVSTSEVVFEMDTLTIVCWQTVSHYISCGHARLCVCLCVCLSAAASPHFCTAPDVTWRMVRDAP